MPELVIPEGLLPEDGRFGSGPSKVRAEAVRVLAAEAPTYLGTSHRQGRVRDVVARVRAGLSELFALPEGYEVVLGNGGTTAFWDAAAFCLAERKTQHLSFGEFSAKFVDCTRAAPFLEEPEVLVSAPGTSPRAVANPDVDAYCLTHNETSTGVQAPVRRPTRPEGGAAEGLVLVDGTSAAGGLRVDPTEFDVYYFAPQKCFGSDGGLWLALFSPAAVDRVERLLSGRPLRARLLGPEDRHLQLPPAADLQHPGACHLAPTGRAGRLVLRQRGSRVGRLALGPLGRDRLRLGGGSEYAQPFVTDPPSAATSLRPSTSTSHVDALEVADGTSRPTGSSTPSPTAS